MSGAAGHLPHLHENRKLTFGELKEVLTKATQGSLEQVTEKFDGMNLVFTWDANARDVFVARSGSDIFSGGMTPEELAERFKGRGAISLAFNQAFQVLRQAVNSLSIHELHNIFGLGEGCDVWYSIEVVYPSGANTLNYDSSCIVFHRSPVFMSFGGVHPVKATAGVDLLASKIEQMQKAVNLRGWRLMGPNVVRLNDISSGQTLQRAINRINEAMAEAACSDADTIGTYLMSMSIDRCKAMGINAFVASAMARRLTNERGAPNVTKLVSMSPGHAKKIQDLVARDKELMAEFMRPIELAISDLACEVLRGMNSVLINDSDRELQRLQSLVGAAIDAVRESGDVSIIDRLETQVNKLRSLQNISSTMEGIVFVFKGQAYKMTGAWAPAHQILSLYRRTIHEPTTPEAD